MWKSSGAQQGNKNRNNRNQARKADMQHTCVSSGVGSEKEVGKL